MLPVCLGRATRLADYLSGGEKSYYGEMRIGYETDTQDIWGKVVKRYASAILHTPDDGAWIRDIFRRLEGDIEQEIPAYSAVKHKGKSMYQYARAGHDVTGMTRPVFIRHMELLWFSEDRIGFRVCCGGGTYVRMLCRDIGRLLGTGGTMSFLLRLDVGPFSLDTSSTLEEIHQRAEKGEASLQEIIQPKELALQAMPYIEVSEQEAKHLRYGQAIWQPFTEEGSSIPGDGVWAKDKQEQLVAIGKMDWVSTGASRGLRFKPDKTF